MDRPRIITVTLNPCIDKTVQVCSFRAGQTNRAVSSREDIGGKGINVSRVLRGSGSEACAAVLVPSESKAAVDDALRAEGLDVLLRETDGRLRVNLKIVDTQDGTLTELNERGAASPADANALFDALLPTLCPADILVLSGSLPDNVPVTLYRDRIREAKAAGVRCILDTTGDALRCGVEAAPYAVKPNREELSALAGEVPGDMPSILRQIRALHAYGVTRVCVSLGADGALFSDGGTVLHAIPFPIRVASCTAAGDAVVAALSFAAAHDLPMDEAARLGCAAGTCTAAKDGTGTASFDEIRQNAPRVKLERM